MGDNSMQAGQFVGGVGVHVGGRSRPGPEIAILDW